MNKLAKSTAAIFAAAYITGCSSIVEVPYTFDTDSGITDKNKYSIASMMSLNEPTVRRFEKKAIPVINSALEVLARSKITSDDPQDILETRISTYKSPEFGLTPLGDFAIDDSQKAFEKYDGKPTITFKSARRFERFMRTQARFNFPKYFEKNHDPYNKDASKKVPRMNTANKF